MDDFFKDNAGDANSSSGLSIDEYFYTMEKHDFIHFVHYESAYQHQGLIFRRATENNRITLGELLARIFDMNISSVSSMAIAYQNEGIKEECIIVDPTYIWGFDLFSCILKRKTEEGHYTQGMFHETTIIVRTKSKNCIFSLTSLGGSDTIKYMRVSVLSPNNSIDDDGRTTETNNSPLIDSFILSYSEIDDNPDIQKYLSIEKSVKEKRDGGRELCEIEKAYIHGQYEFQGYSYIGYGHWLFEQQRYYDALSILKRGYNYLKPRIDENDKEIISTFCGVCNTMGNCLSKLNRNVEATYYYNLGEAPLNLKHASNLALCYAKLGNPIAMRLLKVLENNWSEEVKQLSADVPIELARHKTNLGKEHVSYSNEITIGYILNVIWGMTKNNLFPFMFIYDTKENVFLDRIENADSIYNYLLNVETSVNKVFVLSCTHYHRLTKDEIDKSMLCYHAPIVISSHSIQSNNHTSCIRIDMLRHNFSYNDDKEDFVRTNMPLNTTFTIGKLCDTCYAEDKNGLMDGIRRAISFVDDNRFVEALKLSKWVFECSSNLLKSNYGLEYESKDDFLWSIFFEASYNIGFCLMELNSMPIAEYYLEIASHGKNYKYIQEYINCLTNLQHPQALEVVDNTIQRSCKPETEEAIEMWNFHMAFLKRRKAYILIDKKRYTEARHLLVEMLNDSYCKDFAINEINYLDGIEN